MRGNEIQLGFSLLKNFGKKDTSISKKDKYKAVPMRDAMQRVTEDKKYLYRAGLKYLGEAKIPLRTANVQGDTLQVSVAQNKHLSYARSYGRVLRAEWLFGGYAKIKSQNYKHAKSSGFSEKIAREVALKPHLNIGVFSLEKDAPHWEVWQKNLKKALSSGRIWGSEQIAMNITIYSDNLDVEILPAYCNWTLIDAIKFDKQNNTFVEPYLPNHELGIIHFAGKNNDQIRNDKDHTSKIKTLDGEIINKSLRFRN